MINIQNKIDCCGCNACGDVCTHHAITFKTDNEGFWYPEVNKNLCVDCGLCEKVCPILNKTELKKDGFKRPECYAAIHKNIEVRFDSTSGGAFTAFADEIYRQGGYVGGAVFNEDWSVSQFLSTDKKDLERLRSSKYLQSHFDGFFIAVRDALKTGKPVLVCGGPCQMAALKRFVGKTYDNLIVVDYICRGIPSPLLFKKFIEYLEIKHNSKVIFFKAKNKELGWHNLTSKVVFANNDVEYLPKDRNPWLQMKYEVPETCRPSCFECPFKGFPRNTDITIGDLWTSKGKIPGHLDNDLGTSVVLINTEKGKAFFNKCLKRLNYEEFCFDDAVKGNIHLVKSLKHSNHDKNKFYETLNRSFEGCIENYLNKEKSHKGIKGLIKPYYKFIQSLKRASGWDLATWYKNFYYNFFTEKVETDISKGKYFIIHKHCIIDIHPKGKLILGASFTLGNKRIKGSKLETRLMIEEGGKLIIRSAPYHISYGADIEVFKNALLEIEGGMGSNIGLTIICGNHIYIGRDSGCGRNVTIRDNNGNHFISTRGYKTSLPVVIKDHVWMTESCTIMPGAILETGVIVGAHSVVFGHAPKFCIVKGDPAKVVETDIYWKS